MNLELIRRLDRLSREGATRDPWEHARAFLEMRGAVELEVAAAKPRLLAHLLPWSAEEQALASSFAHAHRQLAALGASISERCLRQEPSDEELDLIEDVIGGSLACHSGAVKWSMLGPERRDTPYNDIHALYHVAELESLHASPRPLEREGATECFSAEARYLHAILLPLFAAAHFDRQKVEIADGLLASWVREYSMAKSAESDDTCLWVDLAGTRGPVIAQYRPDGHSVRLVVVSRLIRHIERALASFDSGKIPGSELAAEFRLEAHVEVLDHLSFIWDRLRDATPPRLSQRSAAQLPGAWLFLNLHEILAGTRESPDAPVRIDLENEKSLRINVGKPLWDRIEPGQLVGLHSEGESYLGIAYVTRKLESASGLEWYLAAEWISRSPRPVIVRSRESALVPRRFSALYLPGAEPSGRADLLIMDDRYDDGQAYDLSVCGRNFTVQPTRAKHKGRGWIANEFAVLRASPYAHAAT